MKRCLDEATLQSYFDGELSTDLMESATSHLASCKVCSAAARELEQENALLTTALAAEFDSPVPTEQLRMRINAAVANLDAPLAAQKSSFFRSFGSLFNFVPQQALAYGGLIVVLAFAAIFGVIKMGSNGPVQPDKPQVIASAGHETPASSASPVSSPEIAPIPLPDEKPQRVVYRPTNTTPKITKRPPVKLLPGERSFLQTIARLDSAINSEKRAMRPALQVEYERNLAVVDRAIAATRTAAKNNPNDPDAADFMFSAYQSKVDLLNTIADARVGGRSH
ncbi:MAG TPA: hypothetical protein VF074_02390 [Pyrinomonadaceae bacterium]